MRRLRREESGFSLLETVVALLLLFALLAALESAAVAGFRYVGFARERQAATSIANQIMEEARGLAYAKVKAGVQTSNLATDPNAVTGCAGDPLNTYRFMGCSGEVIMSTGTNCPTTASDCLVPFVPNTGTCPGSPLPLCTSSSYPVTYTWRTYVTNDNVLANPYRVVVLVSWTGKSVSTAAQQIRMESLFWSPSGCVSSDTHPFAAPCSPFFYGQATASKGTVTLAGSLASTTFSLGTLDLGKSESLLQQEQVSQVQGTVAASGTSVTDGSGTRSGGSTTAQTNAVDADPASAAPQYQATTLTGVLSSQSTSGGGNSITFANIAGDAGAANSATSAGGTAVCPPPTASAETDNLPCGGTTLLPGNTTTAGTTITSAAASISENNPTVGATTILRIGAQPSATTTLADRDPISGQDGIVQHTINRTLGRVDIGGLPAGITSPPAAWQGYFVSLTGFSDSVQATSGSSAAAPTATISAGTLAYWNGAGYTSVNLATTPGYTFPANWTQTVTQTFSPASKRIDVTLSTVGTVGMGSVPTTSSTPAGGGSITRTDTSASIGSPIYGQFSYVVKVNSNTSLSLTITVDLGSITVRSVYQAAPTAG